MIFKNNYQNFGLWILDFGLIIMCAGITFFLDKIDETELSRFLTKEEFLKQKKGRMLESFYWQKRPFLPVLEDGEVHLLD